MQSVLPYVHRKAWQKMSRYIASIFVVLSIGLSVTSHAQVYGGFIAGKSSASNTGDIPGTQFPPMEDSTAYKVSIGNALSPVFAYEFSYIDLGDYVVGDAESAQMDSNELSDQLSIAGVDFVAVGNLAMTRQFIAYVKLGVFYWQGERIIERVDTASGDLVTDIYDNTDLNYSEGLGLRYDFTRSVRFNIEVNRYKTGSVYNLLYGAGFFVTF